MLEMKSMTLLHVNGPPYRDGMPTVVLRLLTDVRLTFRIARRRPVPVVVAGLTVALVTAGAGASAAEPEADVVMKLVDYDFELSKPLTAGRHTIRIENGGPQEHEVVIVKLESGKEAIDFAKWGEKMTGKPPGTLHGGSSGIMPGGKAFVEVDLAPGTYGFVCFVPDSKDGKGHYVHGMAKTVTVS